MKILPRCLVLGALLCGLSKAPAQTPGAAGSPGAGQTSLSSDDRASKLAERYRAMLAANPVEGPSLDRLWKLAEEHDGTAALVEEYRVTAERTGSFADWLIYGHLLKRTGKADEASHAYEMAARVRPGDPLALIASADLALTQHQPMRAAEIFTSALARLGPNDRRRMDLLQKRGDAFMAGGQPAEAAESWEELLAANPDNLALHKQLADTYARNHLIDRALAHLHFLDQHADPPGRAAALREAGRLHEIRGEFDLARDAYESGLALTSRENWLNRELLGAIIRLYQRAGRTAELETRWRLAAEQNPRDLGGLLRLEALAEAEADAKAEIGVLERIIALAPRDRDSRRKLAQLLTAHGEPRRAADLYDGLLKEQPNQLDLSLFRADLDLQLGAPEEAVRRLEEVVAQSAADETVTSPILEFFVSRHLDGAAEKLLRARAERQPGSLDPGISLAKFLFAHHRAEEGRQVLNGLAGAGGPAGKQSAARWRRVGDAYRDENLPADAIRAWEEAARLDPADVAPLAAASELLLTHGDDRKAASTLERVIAALPEGPAREESEHKLFQILSADRSRVEGAAPRPTVTVRYPGVRRHGIWPAAPGSELVLPGGMLEHHLQELEDVARQTPTPPNLMRLARWQSWARLPEAADTAETILHLDPGNIPARQLLIQMAIDAQQYPAAARELEEITARDPAHKAAYQRQLAGVRLELGDFDAAISAYREAPLAHPGSVELLMDLAQAQQRAERWFDALATWKQAYALPALTPSQRTDVRRPLVAAYEHVGEFPPAAELLAVAVDDQVDLARKQSLFQDLVEFCAKHAQTGWLEARYVARLNAQPDDYFLLRAVSAVWKLQGREEEAYDLRRKALFSAPEPASELRALADEADALGDEDQALDYSRRLSRIPGQDTAENLEKLASRQEDSLQEEEAAHTWDLIVSRFPRDTGALAQAAAFLERVGHADRARRVLEQLLAIDPLDLGHLFHLAELDRDAGDVAAAGHHFEEVLSRSRAESESKDISLPVELQYTPDPAASGLRIPGFAAAEGAPPPTRTTPPTAGDDDHVLRLASIRELAQLLPADAETRRRWTVRWQGAAAAGARSEALQAFYSCKDPADTLNLLAHWLAQEPGDARRARGFLLAGLRLGDYGPISAWTWDESAAGANPDRGLKLVEALQQFLSDGGRPDDRMVGELFPGKVRARDLLWQAAREGFAERRWYAQAAELGERVVSLAATGRSRYVLDLEQWELFLDRPERARSALRTAIDEEAGSALDAASGNEVFAALRAYCLLLKPDERPGFVEAYLRECRSRGEPVQSVLAGLQLHGLIGDEAAARRDADALLALRLTQPDTERSVAARRWTYLLNAGAQLESWHLNALAAYLWRQALAGESAFERADVEADGVAAEVAGRLLVLEVVDAPNPEAAREQVVRFLRGRASLPRDQRIAAELLSLGEYPAARVLLEGVTREASGDLESWRNLLRACEGAGELDEMESVLTSLLDATHEPSLAVVGNRGEFVRDLAALRQLQGDAPGARRLLEREFEDGGRSLPIIAALAPAYEQAGLLEEAARVWRAGLEGDRNTARSSLLGLALVDERRGDLPGAIEDLEKAMGDGSRPGENGGVGAHLVQLYLRAGRRDDAKNLTLRLLRENELDPLPQILQAYSEAGSLSTAQEWVRSAVRRAHDPQVRFDLQQTLLESEPVPTKGPAPEFYREIGRLKKFADASPSLKSSYSLARYSLARRAGARRWLQGELQREWQDGKGDFVAGEQLFSLYLESKELDPLQAVVSAIDARPNLPEASLAAIEKRLIEENLAGMAGPLSERLFRRFPQNEVYALARARVLGKSGQMEEANRLLEALDANAVFRDDVSARIAETYEELGDPARAADFYARAVQRDPLRGTPACLKLAQLATAHRHWTLAASDLRLAYRHPAVAADLAPLADFLEASGALSAAGLKTLPGSGFPLSFVRRGDLLALVYRRLKQADRLADARTMVAAHPEFLAASSTLARGCIEDASGAQVPELLGLLDKAAAMTGAATPRLDRERSLLYRRWAAAAANANDPAERLRRLEQAHRLTPDDFDAARDFASVCWESQQADRAAAALQPFLEKDAVPLERRQAAELLSRHASSR